MAHVTKSIEFGGKTLTLETGLMAKQANGAVFVSIGESRVLCTAVSTLQPKPGAAFFPLSCDYFEKFYAAGRIPGSYFKREGRQSETETLNSRIMDRPCRPLFPKGFMAETQVGATVMSFDKLADTAVMAVIGASAALSISDIPWNGPIAACRVGLIDGKFICNPTLAERTVSDLDVFAVVGAEGLVMVEGGAKFVSEQVMIDALLFADEQCRPIIKFQQDFQAEVGKTKAVFTSPEVDQTLVAACRAAAYEKMKVAVVIPVKQERYAAVSKVKSEAAAALAEQFPNRYEDIKEIVSGFKSEICRDQIVETRTRLDGRKLDEVRKITIQTGVLPRAHGSALFTRGETQGLIALTLGTGHDEQRIETLTGMEVRRFMLHYNFPPFSTGEVKPLRGPGRREIGHGALAERGIRPALPSFEMFPYTLRSVSEILESNGSSSMATVCGTSLALMDAGVPISGAVAGIAMGLIQKGDQVRVLSDILGDEDAFGDMDFKVVGSAEGISALQMDIKVTGLSRAILEEALGQAKQGRLHILGEMAKALPRERVELSTYAPRIFTILINPERIKDLIGPGGKNIKSIVATTGAQVDVEEDGTVRVAATDNEVAEAAIAMVRAFTSEAEVGKDYDGVVTRVAEFGAFVRIMPGTEGLVHVSELSEERVESVDSFCKVGDAMKVRVVNVDRMGKVRLSRREALGGAPRPIPTRDGGDRGRGPRRDGDRDRGPRRDGGGGGDRGGDRGGAPAGDSRPVERSDAANERRERRERQPS
jgi:polyribonucleotide nucleotidyltransferase